MKVIMFMTITANGLIARKDDEVDFVSKESWANYLEIVSRAKHMIVGRRTYHLVMEAGELDHLPDLKVVVVSTENFETKNPNHVIVGSPTKAVEIFKDAEEVFLGGGGITNASFLSDNLVDEIILDVESIIFSKGLPLAYGKDFDHRLELLSTKSVGKDGVQLHYKVIK